MPKCHHCKRLYRKPSPSPEYCSEDCQLDAATFADNQPCPSCCQYGCHGCDNPPPKKPSVRHVSKKRKPADPQQRRDAKARAGRKHRREQFTTTPTKQAVLFAGMDCLPGQQDLFQTDGEQ